MELEKERFEAWLFNQPRERRINPFDSHNCVLCSFLKETMQCRIPAFSFTNWKPDSFAFDVVPHPVPDWAQKLINLKWCDEAADKNRTNRPATCDRSIFPMSSIEIRPSKPSDFITCGQVQDRYTELFGTDHEKVCDHQDRGLDDPTDRPARISHRAEVRSLWDEATSYGYLDRNRWDMPVLHMRVPDQAEISAAIR